MQSINTEAQECNSYQPITLSPYFDKTLTNIIKGVMLILMFIHHFFQSPQWYIQGVSYPHLEWLTHYPYQLRICVSVFAFFTGYFYVFNKHQDLHYSLKKILGILIPFWCVFIPYYIIALATNTIHFSLSSFFFEALAIQHNIMIFCWYVIFYSISMLLLPLIVKPKGIKKIVILFVSFYLPSILFRLLWGKKDNSCLYDIFLNFQMFFPMILIGYIVAYFNIFQKIDGIVLKLNNNVIKIFFYSFLLISTFCLQAKLFCWKARDPYLFILPCTFRTLSIPFFLYGLINILKLIKYGIVTKLLVSIGKYSLLMWFIHCLFFNVTREYTQKILFLPKFALLVLVWGLILCYVLAMVFNFISSNIKKKIEHI